MRKVKAQQLDEERVMNKKQNRKKRTEKRKAIKSLRDAEVETQSHLLEDDDDDNDEDDEQQPCSHFLKRTKKVKYRENCFMTPNQQNRQTPPMHGPNH